MPARALPNLGLMAFFDPGEDGWEDEMDLNLLKLSVLTQGGVISRVAVVPGAPAEGDVHIITDAPNANDIAVYDNAAWVYFTPVEGWLVYDRDTDEYLSFDGATWTALATGGGGGGPADPPAVETVAGTAYNLLAADAGKYLRFIAATAKTVTVRADATEALPASGEWHIRNAGATDLTLTEDVGVTIYPPNGGTLVVPEGGTVTLKRVAADEFDLLGQTVAA